MKRIILSLSLLAIVLGGHAQERKVQNRPYTDLREFHFGVLVGTHLQDLELNNVGPQMIDLEDGNGLVEKTISADQDRWDAGFTVGVLGELRLNSTFQLRMAPAMYFGTRHLIFRNITDLNAQGEPTEQVQELKTAYISCAFDLIAAAPRFNNHRPYVMLGKFMYSLMNSLDKSHAKNLQDKNMLMYTNSVNETRAKMIALTFYFE